MLQPLGKPIDQGFELFVEGQESGGLHGMRKAESAEKIGGLAVGANQLSYVSGDTEIQIK
jgi:hypothetical protein